MDTDWVNTERGEGSGRQVRAGGSGDRPRRLVRAAAGRRLGRPAGLLATLALAAGVRAWGLTGRRLWRDEGTSVYLAGLGWRALTTGKDFMLDPHPPA